MVIKGDVVLVQFPFTDLSQSKLHPAIILWIDPVGTDVVVCADLDAGCRDEGAIAQRLMDELMCI